MNTPTHISQVTRLVATGAEWPERTQAWQREALGDGLAVEILPEQSTDGRPLVAWEGAVYVLDASTNADGYQSIRARHWEPQSEAEQRVASRVAAVAYGHEIVEE